MLSLMLKWLVLNARYLATAILVLIAFGSTNISPAAAQTADVLQRHVTASQEALNRYSASHSLQDLYSAVSLMGGSVSLHELTPQNLIEKRRVLVSNWAQIISKIETSYDPTFDPRSRFSCPAPPRESNGIQLPACVRPTAVSDTGARAKYETDLATFQKQLAKAAYYQRLHNIDLWAMSSLHATLNVFADVSPKSVSSDYAALDNILQKAGISNARRVIIEGYIRPRST